VHDELLAKIRSALGRHRKPQSDISSSDRTGSSQIPKSQHLDSKAADGGALPNKAIGGAAS